MYIMLSYTIHFDNMIQKNKLDPLLHIIVWYYIWKILSEFILLKEGDYYYYYYISCIRETKSIYIYEASYIVAIIVYIISRIFYYLNYYTAPELTTVL